MPRLQRHHSDAARVPRKLIRRGAGCLDAGNPASLHSGKDARARAIVEHARESGGRVDRRFHRERWCLPAGAVRGAWLRPSAASADRAPQATLGRIVVSARWSTPSVLESAARLAAKRGFVVRQGAVRPGGPGRRTERFAGSTSAIGTSRWRLSAMGQQRDGGNPAGRTTIGRACRRAGDSVSGRRGAGRGQARIARPWRKAYADLAEPCRRHKLGGPQGVGRVDRPPTVSS